ncbi:alkaline phosphatase family protein [Chloroflexota bacterium]
MSKVVVFGIDGGLLKLIEQWQDELPNLKKIMENGVYGELESTFPPVTCPAWPAMFTGKNPGKLGMYDFTKYLHDQEQIFGINSSLDYSSSAIWNILNTRGKKVGLLNVPMTFPPQKIDSFMVCGIGSPDAIKATYTYPPDLKETLNETVGGYVIYPWVELSIPGKEEYYIKASDEIIRKREKAASYLMGNLPWDLFVCVFYVLDQVQHYFWHHMDESHIRESDERYRDVIKDFYIKVDSAIGRLLEKIPEGTNILVVSDHGFGPVHGTFAVNRWLENNNFLKFTKKIQQRRANAILLKIRKFLLTYLSLRLIQVVAKLLPRTIAKKLTVREIHMDSTIAVYQSIDWSQTRAYGLGLVGMIYINLKGREPHGIVEPGQEYEAVKDEIITKLRQMTDPETGRAVDIQVFTKEEVYHGQYLESAPDILYRMPKYHQSVSIRDKAEWRQSLFSGGHVPEGIFFAWGPDIKQSGQKLPNLKIYDISPTILHLFGLPVPRDMDGRVLTEIFKEDSEPEQREVAYQEVDYEAERIRRKVRELRRLKRL